jgi:hypothetical protein
MNLLFAPEMSIVTIVFSTLAGAICEAIVLFQIKSYNFFCATSSQAERTSK